MSGPFGRNLGLVVALLLICAAGVITAGDRFASVDNILTILRFASTIGVVSIGMTFVITGGGIDLSVGAILALCSVWATTFATQTMAEDTHWMLMVFAALAVGAGCGLVNGVLIAYGKVVPFITTLAMLAAARGLAEIISERRTQIVTRRRVQGLLLRRRRSACRSSWSSSRSSSVGGWVLLNRTTFGRRTLAVGGNPEAARLAGINVNRHTVMLYVLVGLCCGLAALMLVSRTTTGSSTHGTLLRARRHRGRRHRRHAAHRRSRHDRRHRPRRPHLHHPGQRLHPQQPGHLDPGRRQGRDHRRRRAAPAAPGPQRDVDLANAASPPARNHRTTMPAPPGAPAAPQPSR